MSTNKPSLIRSVLFAVFLGGVIFWFFSNKKFEPQKFVSTPEIPEVVKGSIQLGENESSPKLNHYIDCMNRQSSRAYDSYRRYLSWVDKEKGPTGSEKHIYGLYTLYDLKKCQKGITEAAGLYPDKQELEITAEAFWTSLSELHGLIEVADRYYDQKDYLDDGMKKGQELHTQLMNAFESFIKNDQEMRELIDTDRKERHESLKKEWAQKGKESEPMALEIMDMAREMYTISWGKSWEEIELESISTLVDDFEAKSKALTIKSTEEPLEWSVNTYLDKCQKMLKAAKALKRRIRDKSPYNRSEEIRIKSAASWTVEGSPAQLRRAYNDLARVFNQLELNPKPTNELFIPNFIKTPQFSG